MRKGGGLVFSHDGSTSFNVGSTNALACTLLWIAMVMYYMLPLPISCLLCCIALARLFLGGRVAHFLNSLVETQLVDAHRGVMGFIFIRSAVLEKEKLSGSTRVSDIHNIEDCKMSAAR